MTNEQEPLVSIVMTTYNRSGYIAETIHSIQAQSYTNWELLIEDDGSEDNTAEVVMGINDPRIVYTAHTRTAVTGTLKNRALKKAKGVFIAFMDSDDLWEKHKLERQVAALRADKDAGWSYTNWADFYTLENLQKPYYTRTTGSETIQALEPLCTAEKPVSTATVMFKSSCLEKVGLFYENRLFTDFSFIARLAYRYKAAIFYEPLLYRRLHESNNIGTNWEDDFVEYQETMQRFVSDGWIDYKTIRQTVFLSYINLGEKFYVIKNKPKAIKNYLNAWKCNPLSIIPPKKLIKTLFL